MSKGPPPPPEPDRRRPARRLPSLSDFELLRELGSGTTGTVYLATLRRPLVGLRIGDPVAVKFLHQHLLGDAAARRRFLREARAGMEVRSQHLVRVYAVEETELLGTQMLYLVMELVEGATLRELLREGPLAEPLVRSVGAHVARGLAALHAKGSAHLDVKPENVVLARGGRAVVMDLGFVRSLAGVADSDRDEYRDFMGSLAYASPERLRGQAPTPQSDVYSLGVLLYELATGERPFTATDPGAVIRAHLELAPVAPSARNPRLSPFLDAVLLACLEKLPARRIASAAALAEVLERGEASKFWRERLAERSRGPAGRRPHLTTFHGRENELRELESHYARVATGAFRLVDVAGESGLGKTRLVDEFVAAAAAGEDPPLSLYGRCARVGEASPAEPFLAMLGRYLGIPRGGSPDAGAARRLRELVPAPQARVLLEFGASPQGQIPVESFARAFVEFLAKASEEAPIVAFLDDADSADPATAAVLLAVAEGAPPRVLLVIGRRPVPSRADAALAAAQERRSLVSLPLAPLPGAALGSIVDDLVEPDARRVELRDALARAAAGNPGHVAEALRTLRASGALAPVDAGATPGGRLRFAAAFQEMPIAPSLSAAILERLRALDPEERRALEGLAVAGDRCEPALLAAAFGGDELGWLRTLSRLEGTRGLLSSSAGAFRFARPMLHEVIYQSIPEEARAEAHGKLASALERSLGANPSDRERLRVAEHARRSGDAALALRHLPRLAEDLRRRGFFERALVLARAAIDLLNRLPRKDTKNLELRFDGLATIAECHSRMGNRPGERVTLEKCARIARYLRDQGRLARTLLSLGRFSHATGRYLVAESYLGRAIELAHAAGDARTEAEACVAMATVAQYTGQIEPAGPLLDRALALATDRDLRGRVLLQQGLRWLNVDRPDLALPQIEEASQLFKELRMPAAQAAAHFHRARAYADFGRLDKARRDLDRAVALARESGERRTEAMALSLRGSVRASQRDAEGAERDLRASSQIAGEIGDRFTECHSSLHLANALLSTHNPKKNQKEALRLARLALAIAEALELPRLRALAHAIRSRAYLCGSRVSEALQEAERGVAVLAEGPHDRRREAAVHYNHGLALRTSGQTGEAVEAFARAAAVIRARAEGIPDPALRRAFLEDEPFHRKVLAAAQ